MPTNDPFQLVARRAATTAAYNALPTLTGSTIGEWVVTEKETVKRNPERYRTNARADVRISSSGSTGQPMPSYRTWSETESNAHAVAAQWKALLGEGISIASVLDHNTAAAGQLLELVTKRNGWPLARLFPYRIAGARFDQLAVAFNEFRPNVIVTTPSGAIDIEQAWHSAGLFDDASSSVTSLLLIGAPATPSMQSRLARSWGADAYIASYGSTELGTIACGCEDGQLHILDGRHHLELRGDGIIRPLDVGSFGELIATPFFSEATQLVRYATGDTMAGVRCSCGSTSTAINIAGRSDDFVLVEGNAMGPELIEHAVFVAGGAGDYLLEVDEDLRLSGIQVLPLGNEPVDLDAIAAVLLAPARRVERLPSLARAGGAVKSWRRTRVVTSYKQEA